MGLGIFTASQRIKEIGIRKVLGAGRLDIFTLLSKEFMILVALAFLIASPVAWFIMNNWLNDYAYRTNISWWLFPVSGAAAMFIAMFTISFQAIRSALANPVSSLRSE